MNDILLDLVNFLNKNCVYENAEVKISFVPEKEYCQLWLTTKRGTTGTKYFYADDGSLVFDHPIEDWVLKYA